MAPVQRDGMEYEFSMFLEIDADHQAFVSKDRTGVIDGQYFTVTPEVGVKLAHWLEGGAPVTTKDVVVSTYAGSQASTTNTLADIIVQIDSIAKSLPDKGISKADITATIKGITGGIANYNNITDKSVAEQVLVALKKMED